MSMLKKFNEHKKAMHEKLDKIAEEHAKEVEKIGNEFLEEFKSLVSEASEEEFVEFLHDKENGLDEMDKIAAMTMRLEAKYGRHCKDDENKKEGPGIAVFVL